MTIAPSTLAELRAAGFLAPGEYSPRGVALAVSALVRGALKLGLRVASEPPVDSAPDVAHIDAPIGEAEPSPEAEVRRHFLERLAKVQADDDAATAAPAPA